MKATFVAVFVLVALPVVSWKLGQRAMEQKLEVKLLEARQTSDSLKRERDSAYAAVIYDTVKVTVAIDRWREAKAQIFRDTVRDTVWAERIVRVADSTILEVDQGRRQCVGALSSCQAALVFERARADSAWSVQRMAQETSQRQLKWRSLERGLCATSVGANIFQWKSR